MPKYPSELTMRDHFDWVAGHDDSPRRLQRGYHTQMLRYFRHHIPEGSRVLEWGCGAGDLVAGLKPGRGLGLDFSPRMIDKARVRHGGDPALEFHAADIESDPVAEPFDHLVLDCLTGYLPDIQTALKNLHGAAHPRTRLHLTTINTLWLGPLRIAAASGLVSPQPPSNWLSHGDLFNLLELAGWEVITCEHLQLFPFEVPLLSALLNDLLVKLPVIRHLGLTVAITARPRRAPALAGEVSCSVVVPARNEAGNIRAALERIPVLGRRTEVIFVEGHSTDDTWDAIRREAAAYRGPHLVQALRQPGIGKWDAVRTGLAAAQGDVLVIQDADLTAPPEDLPKFFDALAAGTAEFVNGSRLVYPVEKRAMRFLNLLGNKFFSVALSSVLGQPLKDSLCGTKMLLRSDYERLLRRIAPFGAFDPFGDFNLLFGAALLDLRIRDVPVRYRDRTYGSTNISRFRHGWQLLKMTWWGLRHLRLRWHF
jgi:SAM-dependent methyltransferase